MNEQDKLDIRVAVLVFPFSAPNTFTLAGKIVAAVSTVAAKTILISGGIPAIVSWPEGVEICDIGIRLHRLQERQPAWVSAILWIAKMVLAQARFALELFRMRGEIDAVFCTVGLHYQLPILAARLMRKKVLYSSFGHGVDRVRINYGRELTPIATAYRWFNLRLSHGIMIESFRLVEQDELAHYRSKLYVAPAFLDDWDRFCVQTPVAERQKLVGFVGRLTPEKGLSEFLQAIPRALTRAPKMRFLIIGAGGMEEAVERIIEEYPSSVDWLGWVENKQIPYHLNRLKLLVMPSHIEGMPGLVLEALACGTPVLASGVGGIPDLIIDAETGFLLSDRSPQTISEAIVRLLDDPRLEEVTIRGRVLLAQNHTLQATRTRYYTMLSAIMRGP